MENDSDKEPSGIVPANDNDAGDEPSTETWQRIDRAALTLAHIIGCRMAREDFERLYAAKRQRGRSMAARVLTETDTC